MKRSVVVTLTVVALLALPPPAPALADPGDLDATFGSDGWAFTGLGDADVFSMAVGAGDDLVVAGRLDERFAVWRMLPDGSPDPSFGAAGVVVVPFRHWSGAVDLGLLPDGRVVAVGWAGRRIVAARFLSNGDPDTTFGGDGIVTLLLGEQTSSIALELEILPDESLLVGGRITRLGVYRDEGFVLRLGADGALDATFGVAGMIVDARTFGAMTIDGGGLLVALRADRHARIVLARFDLSGQPDTTFGGDGDRSYCIFVDDCDGYDLYTPSDLVVDAEGNVIVTFGGYIPNGGRVDAYGVMRLTPDGDRDPTFSGDGVRTFLRSWYAGPRALALQDDGSILVAGWIFAGGGSGENWPVLARLLPDGRLDPAFGDGGIVFVLREQYFWSDGSDLVIASPERIILLIDVVYDPGLGLAAVQA